MYTGSTVHSVQCTARVSGGTQYRVSWPASRLCEIMVTVGCSDKSRFSSLVLASLLRSSATAIRGKGTIAETYFHVKSFLIKAFFHTLSCNLDRVFPLDPYFELHPVFRIQIHKMRIPDADSLVGGTDPVPDPDLSIRKIGIKTLISTLLWLLYDILWRMM